MQPRALRGLAWIFHDLIEPPCLPPQAKTDVAQTAQTLLSVRGLARLERLQSLTARGFGLSTDKSVCATSALLIGTTPHYRQTG
jgi:hypothetical protein